MVKLTQKTVAAFFSPQRKRTTRVNRKLEEAEPVFSESSSSEDDPAHFALERKSRAFILGPCWLGSLRMAALFARASS